MLQRGQIGRGLKWVIGFPIREISEIFEKAFSVKHLIWKADSRELGGE